MMQRPTLIKYRNYRYLKATGLLVAIAIVAYASASPAGGEPYGGTWLGYALGIISTLIMLLLMWYGICKRRISCVYDRRKNSTSNWREQEDTEAQANSSVEPNKERRRRHAEESWSYGGTLQGWLSAHIYLGASLVILASLHAGFQFGWNVHTLSYVLMLLIIASGFYGVFAYLTYPRLITKNMGKDTLGGLLLKIAELDELARVNALDLPDEVNALVLKARLETRLGGSFFQQLSGSQRDCPTDLAVRQIPELGGKFTQNDQPKLLRNLYSVLLQKQKLVSQVRNEIALNARMQFWLYLHAPLSIALLAALIAHIVAVFFYW